jgi:hypothetical protein
LVNQKPHPISACKISGHFYLFYNCLKSKNKITFFLINISAYDAGNISLRGRQIIKMTIVDGQESLIFD